MKSNIQQIESWFERYTRSFLTGDPERDKNYRVKIDHSQRVCAGIAELGKSMKVNENDADMAWIAGLLHDVGRFEQLSRYGTFIDFLSENHAVLGVKILREEAVLEDLDPEARDIILKAVAHHNRPKLPEDMGGKCQLCCRILRDADKLDILGNMFEVNESGDSKLEGSVAMALPDLPEISKDAYQDLVEGRIVDASHIRTRNDLKLLHMGWVYDLNFDYTLRSVKEKGYLQNIKENLPQTEQVEQVYNAVRRHLERKVSGRRSSSRRQQT
ncbi:MAG TPA: HD domain-containing protein [Syntrophales bacterium]|nr:HD domain-containing protein [Syntrophales bacterium]